MLRARRVPRPNPSGSGTVDHKGLRAVLSAVSGGGIGAIGPLNPEIAEYIDELATVDPDELPRDEALAFWLNLYNAGALRAAGQAKAIDADSVLRIPGALTKPWIEIAGERLSLDQIEHGKIRRFSDPRIHGSLICGSVSCPTLRETPFTGTGLDDQLEDQMTSFMSRGGGSVDRATRTVTLSRVFKWYGRDFVAPSRMPTILPAGGNRIAAAVAPWLSAEDAAFVTNERPAVRFAAYDWGLGCSIA